MTTADHALALSFIDLVSYERLRGRHTISTKQLYKMLDEHIEASRRETEEAIDLAIAELRGITA